MVQADLQILEKMTLLKTTRLVARAIRWAAALSVAGACLLFSRPAVAATPEAVALEYKVKAGYLFNFAKFVECLSLAAGVYRFRRLYADSGNTRLRAQGGAPLLHSGFPASRRGGFGNRTRCCKASQIAAGDAA